MYRLKPARVYALDAVLADADAAARMNRILAAIGVRERDVRIFSRDEAQDVAREINSRPADAPAADVPPEYQKMLVFTSIVTDGKAEDDPLVAGRPEDVPGGVLEHILGYITLVKDTHAPEDDRERNHVCWNTQDFGVMTGCPHGCHYCGEGKSSRVIAIGCNIEEYMERVVGPVIEKHPGQK